jgi:nitronate monooxygenase
MPFRTDLTDRLGVSIPVIQAPMAGGGDTAELVAAVSNAGGLGSIGAAYLTPEQIIERGRLVRARTSRPFGINLFAPQPDPVLDSAAVKRAVARIAPYFAELGLPPPAAPELSKSIFDEQLAAVLQTGARMFSFTFGPLPPDTIRMVQRRGVPVAGTATTVREAQQLVEAGVDMIIAQGSEAGGHRGTYLTDFDSGSVGSMALIPQIKDAVPIPVVGAGGIMDGRGVAAALLLGASAVQMGTAFLICDEAGVPLAYKEAILKATEEQTRVTRAFSGRAARGIVNRVLGDYQGAEEHVLPFPLQNVLTRPLRTEAARQNRPEYLSLWAGQGLRLARRGSAAQLVARLDAEIVEALKSAVSGIVATWSGPSLD